jgi:hypothetical protein
MLIVPKERVKAAPLGARFFMEPRRGVMSIDGAIENADELRQERDKR